MSGHFGYGFWALASRLIWPILGPGHLLQLRNAGRILHHYACQAGLPLNEAETLFSSENLN